MLYCLTICGSLQTISDAWCNLEGKHSNMCYNNRMWGQQPAVCSRVWQYVDLPPPPPAISDAWCNLEGKHSNMCYNNRMWGQQLAVCSRVNSCAPRSQIQQASMCPTRALSSTIKLTGECKGQINYRASKGNYTHHINKNILFPFVFFEIPIEVTYKLCWQWNYS